MSAGRSFLVCALVGVVGCAQGKPGGEEGPDGGRPMRIDADPSVVDAPPVVADAEPDAPPHIDAPPGTPDAAPCTVQQIQLLANPAFDAGVPPWVESSAYPIIGAPPPGVTPNTNPNLAWMGDYNNAVDRMYQDVAIPATATALELRGFVLIASLEESTIVYDTASLELRTTGDAVLATLASWDNGDATGNWVALTLPAPSAYAGQTVRVDLHVQTDFSYPTALLFDSMQLLATVCQ